MEDGQLEIATHSAGPRPVVELRGELDLASARRLDEAVRDVDMSSGELVLDLRGVAFIDSTGLRSLLTAHESLRERGVRMLVTNGQPQVARLLQLTGADTYLNVIDAP